MDQQHIKKQVLQNLRENGTMNHLQAEYVASVAELVHEENLEILKPYKELRTDRAYKIANQLVLQFMKNNNLEIAISSAGKESDDSITLDTLKELDLNCLKLKNDKNALTQLVKIWKGESDKIIKINNTKLTEQINNRLQNVSGKTVPVAPEPKKEMEQKISDKNQDDDEYEYEEDDGDVPIEQNDSDFDVPVEPIKDESSDHEEVVASAVTNKPVKPKANDSKIESDNDVDVGFESSDDDEPLEDTPKKKQEVAVKNNAMQPSDEIYEKFSDDNSFDEPSNSAQATPEKPVKQEAKPQAKTPIKSDSEPEDEIIEDDIDFDAPSTPSQTPQKKNDDSDEEEEEEEEDGADSFSQSTPVNTPQKNAKPVELAPESPEQEYDNDFGEDIDVDLGNSFDEPSPIKTNPKESVKQEQKKAESDDDDDDDLNISDSDDTKVSKKPTNEPNPVTVKKQETESDDDDVFDVEVEDFDEPSPVKKIETKQPNPIVTTKPVEEEEEEDEDDVFDVEEGNSFDEPAPEKNTKAKPEQKKPEPEPQPESESDDDVFDEVDNSFDEPSPVKKPSRPINPKVTIQPASKDDDDESDLFDVDLSDEPVKPETKKITNNRDPSEGTFEFVDEEPPSLGKKGKAVPPVQKNKPSTVQSIDDDDDLDYSDTEESPQKATKPTDTSKASTPVVSKTNPPPATPSDNDSDIDVDIGDDDDWDAIDVDLGS